MLRWRCGSKAFSTARVTPFPAPGRCSRRSRSTKNHSSPSPLTTPPQGSTPVSFANSKEIFAICTRFSQNLQPAQQFTLFAHHVARALLGVQQRSSSIFHLSRKTTNTEDEIQE